MSIYVISTHGNCDWQGTTTVPQRVSVRFYQRFGAPMDNKTGLLLQSAIVDPTHPNADSVKSHFPGVALWNAGTFQPAIVLSGDNDVFYSGIVCAQPKAVVHAIGVHDRMTLSDALAGIAHHSLQAFGSQDVAVVHCLFCL